ncbi:MAG: glycosyltransferase [Calditrichaeota bacterium]|nr:glycosyltransferase [Calditrichota bacterium]RQV99757.1 MAG: glycosyltransferase [Calditrichota bacterium]
MKTLTVFDRNCVTSPDDYLPFIGEERIESLKQIADSVRNRYWTNVNSTLEGGGVAEMLQSVIPLARGLGVRADWYVINGNHNFFQVTKKFHNMLQGVDQPITMEEIFGAYLDTINENAKNTLIASDMTVVHDPQPAALIMNEVIFGNILWRCHIDTSSPNQIIWRFLLPYINMCSGAIFTMPEFVGPGLHIPIYQITPCIDPLAEKNHQYSESEALDILSELFNLQNIDAERPIIAAISRYDVHKNQSTIIKAFKQLQQVKKFKKPPYLIFLGNTSVDDPEGDEMLVKLRNEAGEDTNIRFWVNVKDNDRVVGALMRIAQVFIHVSTSEGFGLVVSEAMWQGTPVIGSCVGGITRQVIDGDTGYLVHPLDSEKIAKETAKLLESPEEREALGQNGQEHIRTHFLLPELVRKYLRLLQFFTGRSRELPPFRLNKLSYSEILHHLRIPNPLLPALQRLSSGLPDIKNSGGI